MSSEHAIRGFQLGKGECEMIGEGEVDKGGKPHADGLRGSGEVPKKSAGSRKGKSETSLITQRRKQTRGGVRIRRQKRTILKLHTCQTLSSTKPEDQGNRNQLYAYEQTGEIRRRGCIFG